MKKRWLVLCCVGVLTAFAMVGCGSSDEEQDAAVQETVDEEAVVDEETEGTVDDETAVDVESEADGVAAEEEVPAEGEAAVEIPAEEMESDKDTVQE